jgi:hypothetical protein
MRIICRGSAVVVARGKESDEEPTGPFQVRGYLDLLKFPVIPSVIDAIIVPSNRPAEQLRFAVQLAAQAGCPLLALYADDFPAGLSEVVAGLERDKAIPLALPGDLWDSRLPDLGAALPPNLVSPSASAISKKRNLALLIARACRWKRVLFLDDDISGLSIDRLAAAAALLNIYPVVGFQVKWFPDTSVVGHARRMLGYLQVPFVSGGCLLVDPRRFNGFFPPIYHDDWLCLITHLRSGQVAVGGMVEQVSYDPFSSPDRAENEEFGEILGSGFLWLLHTHKGDPIASRTIDDGFWRHARQPMFWADVLRERAELLKMVAERFRERYPHNSAPQESLEAARRQCAELKPGQFVPVTSGWASNLDAWRKQLRRLPRADSVHQALVRLKLLDRVREYPGSTPAEGLGLA